MVLVSMRGRGIPATSVNVSDFSIFNWPGTEFSSKASNVNSKVRKLGQTGSNNNRGEPLERHEPCSSKSGVSKLLHTGAECGSLEHQQLRPATLVTYTPPPQRKSLCCDDSNMTQYFKGQCVHRMHTYRVHALLSSNGRRIVGRLVK